MNKKKLSHSSLNSSITSVLAALLCILIGLVVGFLVLLAINPAEIAIPDCGYQGQSGVFCFRGVRHSCDLPPPGKSVVRQRCGAGIYPTGTGKGGRR